MSRALPRPIIDLIESFSGLPGVGPKSASRLAFHLLRAPDAEVQQFAKRLATFRDQLVTCNTCQNIALASPCELCADLSRDASMVCVVEDSLDVVALEKSASFKGRYHVLQGLLSPLDGIGPEQLKIKQLERNLAAGTTTEVILALNPTVEGEATTLYLSKQIAAKTPAITITRLAHGLPVGADLEHADEVTLTRALEGRNSVSAQSAR